MGIADRREREKQEVRDKILDAARELFATDGYEATSMRKIAEKVEYSPTAIYLHFKDKEALVHELCMSDFAQLSARAVQVAKVADPIERLKQLAQMYVGFALEHPNHYRLMFMTPLPKQHPTEEELQRMQDPDEDSYAFLLHTVNEAMQAGRFRAELKDPEMVAQVLWSAVHGVASLHIVKGHEEWIDMRPASQLTEAICDAVLAGLARK